MTPLDFSVNSNVQDFVALLEANDFTVMGRLMMRVDLEQISHMAVDGNGIISITLVRFHPPLQIDDIERLHFQVNIDNRNVWCQYTSLQPKSVAIQILIKLRTHDV